MANQSYSRGCKNCNHLADGHRGVHEGMLWVDWTPELALKLQGPLFSKISHVFQVLRGLGLAALFSCK